MSCFITRFKNYWQVIFMNYDKISVCASSLFASFSLMDLENILSIIILILSIINILIVLASKIYNKIKDGKLTSEEIQEITEDIKQRIDEINNIKKGVK